MLAPSDHIDSAEVVPHLLRFGWAACHTSSTIAALRLASALGEPVPGHTSSLIEELRIKECQTIHLRASRS